MLLHKLNEAMHLDLVENTVSLCLQQKHEDVLTSICGQYAQKMCWIDAEYDKHTGTPINRSQ